MKRNQYHFLWLFSLKLLSDINCWTMVCSCIYNLDIWNWCLMGQAVFFGDVDLLHLHPRSWDDTAASVIKSQEGPDRQLVLERGVTQQSLLLQLLKLLGAGEAERMRPEISSSVNECWTQRLSSERVQEGWLWYRARVDCRHLLGLANLSVGLSKLQTDGLRKVGVEPHSLLEVLLGCLGAGSATEGNKTNRWCCLAILAGHFQQGALITLICSE